MIEFNEKLAEFIGIVIGDGFLDGNFGHYNIGIVGHPIKDKEYYYYIQKLIKEICDKDVRIVHRARGLRMTFGCKELFQELTQNYDLPIGEGKCQKVVIPRIIMNDWNLAKFTIKGIADTDGSVFCSNKPGAPNYPSIEITTSNINLAEQARLMLIKQGFRVAKIWKYKSKNSSVVSYKIPLNGYKNLELWIQKIGFSNGVKLKKAIELIK
jgi:hypothetical protein